MSDAQRAENGGSLAVYATNQLKENGFRTGAVTGALEVADNGIVYVYPTIPEGFIASDIATEDSVGEGLVIYQGTEKVSTDTDAQTTRNQFVWIPVNNMSSFVLRDGYLKGKPQTYVSGGYSMEPFSKPDANGVILSLENDLTGEFAEYAAMKASVEKYGGFYVARYEAGDADVTSERTGITKVVHTVVSKKDAFIYNYVSWGKTMTDISDSDRGPGAVTLARSNWSTLGEL